MNKFENEFLATLIKDYEINGSNTDFDAYALKLNTYEHEDIQALIKLIFEGDAAYIIQFAVYRLATNYQDIGHGVLLDQYRKLAMDIILAYLDAREEVS